MKKWRINKARIANAAPFKYEMKITTQEKNNILERMLLNIYTNYRFVVVHSNSSHIGTCEQEAENLLTETRSQK